VVIGSDDIAPPDLLIANDFDLLIVYWGDVVALN
jgi:hypothetical protein